MSLRNTQKEPFAWEHQFGGLSRIRGIVHGFTGRIPGVDCAGNKEEVIPRLEASYRQVVKRLVGDEEKVILAEQVHGDGVAMVKDATGWNNPVQGVDAIVTAERGVCLGIMVADCAAVYLVDTITGVIGLVHSGKKGSQMGIVGKTIQVMVSHYGAAPRRMLAFISPCVRPPRYEIDFAAKIRNDLYEIGVEEVLDCGICTGSNLQRWYSYRMEEGKTGRMMAFLALK